MKEEITVEVDPNELSNEVQESLVKEGVLEEEKAKDYGDSVWFEEIDISGCTRKGIVGYLEQRMRDFKQLVSSLYWLFTDYKTVLGDIESVERTDNDKVKLCIVHERLGTKTATLHPDSNKIANLVEWKGFDNPLELKGSRVPVIRESFNNSYTIILIPHNVSTLGCLRFSLYSGIEEVRVKTRISSIYENLESFAFGSTVALSISSILLMPAVIFETSGMELLSHIFILPFCLVIIGLGTVIFYQLLRGFLSALSGFLHSDYIRVRCD